MPRIAVPEERILPPGPARNLVVALHELYQSAGRPPLRQISSRASATEPGNNSDVVSHESIRKMLRGEVTPNWQKWELLVRCLVANCIDKSYVLDDELRRFNRLWNSATEYAEGQLRQTRSVTGRSTHPVAPPAPNREAMLDLRRAERAAAEIYRQARAAADRTAEEAAAEAQRVLDARPATVVTERPPVLVQLGVFAIFGLLVGGIIGLIILPLSRIGQVTAWLPIIGPLAGVALGLFTGGVLAAVPTDDQLTSVVLGKAKAQIRLAGLVGLCVGAIAGYRGTSDLTGFLMCFAGGAAISTVVGCLVLSSSPAVPRERAATLAGTGAGMGGNGGG